MRQIDEAASLVHVFRTFRRIGLMHLRGRAEVGDTEARGGQILQGSFQSSAAELGAFREVHLILNAAQLERCEPP